MRWLMAGNSPRRTWLLLGAVAGVLLGNNLAGYRPLTSHEVLVAQTAREMMGSGEWIVPRYYGQLRLQKPPLAYWSALISYQAFGRIDESSARAPFALAGVLLVLLIAILAANEFGTSSGACAGILLLTSVWLQIQARLAEADILLCLFVAIAFGCYWQLVREDSNGKPNRPWTFGFWIASALCVLAKGPIGLMMIAGVVLSHCAWSTRWQKTRRLFFPSGLLAFICLIIPWPAALLWRTPEAWTVWTAETVGRFLVDPNDIVRHPFYYPWAALWLTLPWTPLWIGWLIRLARSGTGVGEFEKLLLCWLFVPMAMLSLSAGKQEHYLMPALAPCSILAARMLANWNLRPVWRIAVPSAVVGSTLVVQFFVLPVVYHHEALQGTITLARKAAEPRTPVVALGHSVQWMCFYLDNPMIRVDSLEEFLDRHSKPGTWVLTTQHVLKDLQAHRAIGSVHQLESGDRSVHSRSPVLVQLRPESSVLPLLAN